MTNRKDTIIVTGAAGFVGSAVVDRLAGRYDVIACDREAPKKRTAAEFIPLDVTSDDSVRAALARVRAAHGGRIASVIHLAAYFDLTGEDDPKYDAVTVHGTERLLQALQSFELEQFVFMSSLLVHVPSGHGRKIDEDAPLSDRLPYPASKIRTERLLHEQHGKIPLVVLRAAGVYDELCHAAFLDHQIARIHERRLISHLYPGDLGAGQPYLHLADLIDALERAIERRSMLPPDVTFLLGESDVMGFDEIQQAVGQQLHGQPWPTLRIPAPIAEAGAWTQDKVLQEDPFVRPWMVEIASDHYEIDTSRARTLLGWAPAHSLRATLPVMLDALRKDPVGWYKANHLDSALVAADGVEARSPRAHDGGAPKPPARTPHSEHPSGRMPASHVDLSWAHWLNLLLGAWLLASPFAFGSFDTTEFSAAVRHVTLDRHLANPAVRSMLLGRSDILSGLLVMAFAVLSMSPRLSWARWANAGVGSFRMFVELVLC
ncbi:MAG: NAD-dependent epimerase/dehydratase family protein, partial [Vitreoscilla sp.]